MDRTNDTHDEINVMGSPAKLKQLVERFGAEISDRFTTDDWNIVVKREQCDAVTDWCQRNQIDWRLL